MSARAWSRRSGLLPFLAVVALVVAATGGYVWHEVAEAEAADRPTAATEADRALDVSEVLDESYIAFRSTATGPTYGKLTVVPLAEPGGPRAATSTTCDRVYATADATACVAADRGIVTETALHVLDSRLEPVRQLPLNGLPNRARVSDDGSLAGTTTFVTGHSYTDVSFSTETLIHDLAAGTTLGNLETWRILIDGEVSTAVDLNVWGVTFEPGPRPDRFWATVTTGGRTWLAEGSIADRELRTVHPDVECPSVSPDGTRLAFKEATTMEGHRGWRVAVLDLASGDVTTLAETRNVDDQPAWLDADRVMYGLQRAGSAQTDVWVVPADGTGAPELLVPLAWSPGVVLR